MRQIKARRVIRAPREEVFDVTAHIDNYAEVIPNITNVELISGHRTGVGTRFRETRQMGKRSATTELEVTEYDPPNTARFVSDEGGTIWDTRYRYEPTEEGTELSMVMDVKPYTLMAKLMTPFITRVLGRALEANLDAVKAHCEGR